MIPVQCISQEIDADATYPLTLKFKSRSSTYIFGQFFSEHWNTPIFQITEPTTTVIHDRETKGSNSVKVVRNATDNSMEVTLSYPISKIVSLVMYSDGGSLRTSLNGLQVALTDATITSLASAIAAAIKA